QLAEVDRQRAFLHKRLDQPLTASEWLSDMQGWENQVGKARELWNRASAAYQGGQDLLGASWQARLEDLDQELKQDERELGWARNLDDIRQQAGTLVESKWRPWRAVAKCTAVFADMGLEVRQGSMAALVRQVKASRIRHALAATLDYWV